MAYDLIFRKKLQLMKSAETPTLLGRVVKAGSVTVLGNGASQVLRFASNLVLTRLLFPEAFGLMAIAQSILTGANLISDVGLSQSVVRSARGHEPRFLNTVWTMQVVKGLLLMLAMIIISPVVAKGYHQPALVWLMPGLGLASAISGLASMKIALVNRKIEVGRLTAIELGSQFFGIVVMIVWAWLFPTPWALVGGNLANALGRTVGSQVFLHGPRDRLAWDRSVIREIFTFGGWVMLSSTVTFLSGEGRNLLNAALVDAKAIGLLVLSTTLSLIVWNAIQSVSGRVLFAAYAEVWRERPQNLPAAVERSRRIQLAGGCAVALIFALAGDRLVGWFYDPRYRAAGAFLQIQAVGTCFTFLSASYTGVLWAIGRAGLSTLLLAVQVMIMGVLIVAGDILGGPVGLVAGTALSGLLMYPVTAAAYARLGLFQPKTDWLPLLLGALLSLYVYRFGSWHHISL